MREEKKRIRVNGKALSREKLHQNFPCLLFSPESLSIIKQGPDKRRSLVDEFLLITGQSSELRDFKRCLKNRNQILQNIQRVEEKSTDSQEKVLEIINGQFISLSAKLCRARWKALQGLEPYLNQAVDFIFGSEGKKVHFHYYQSKELLQDFSAPLLEGKISSKIKSLEDAEKRLGTSLVGPQKDDIQILFDGENSRYYCSQGQQRALILSFKIAEVLYYKSIFGETPLLLLDDVLSEMDEKRRKNLIDFLRQIKAQIILTTTSKDLLQSLREEGSSYYLKKGRLEITKDI